MSMVWGDTHRFKRLEQLLAGREIHTGESFVSIQLDTLSYAAATLVPLFARDLWHRSGIAARDETAQLRNAALQLLFEWDGDMSEHRPEPLIFAAWARAVQKQLIQDDLGSLAGEFRIPDPDFLERAFEDVNGAAAWCDIAHTNAIESCDEIALLALDEAVSQLSESYGDDVSAWRWGNAHQARHDHPVFGRNRLMSWLFSIRQSTSGGDHTLNNGSVSGAGENPFESVHGPGYRGVYDFSDLDSSQFIIATGQSGHPFSRHFDDLSQLWKSGLYAVMSLDPVNARANSIGITTLEPATRQ